MIIELKEEPNWRNFILTICLSLCIGYLMTLFIRILDYFISGQNMSFKYVLFPLFLILGILGGTYWINNFKPKYKCSFCREAYYDNDLTELTDKKILEKGYVGNLCCRKCLKTIKEKPFTPYDKQLKSWRLENENIY